MSLTVKQQLVLEYVRSLSVARDFPPTMREISVNCALGGPTSAHRIVIHLRDAGYLETVPGRSRAIRVIPRPVPHVGGVQAAMLQGAAALHAQFRDHALMVAARVDEPSIKSELINDCARRDELVGRVYESAADCDVPEPRCAVELKRLAGAVTSTHSWHEFVVDYLVFNSVTADCARALAERCPPAENCLRDISNVGQASADRGRRWIERLPPSASSVAVRRANSVRQMCMRAWFSAARDWV